MLPRIGIMGAALASSISSIVMLVVKSVLGERVYRCSDNYYKLAISLASLFGTAVIHMFVYEHWIKYLLYLFAIIVAILCYIKEVKTIILLLCDIMKKFTRRYTGNE